MLFVCVCVCERSFVKNLLGIVKKDWCFSWLEGLSFFLSLWCVLFLTMNAPSFVVVTVTSANKNDYLY